MRTVRHTDAQRTDRQIDRLIVTLKHVLSPPQGTQQKTGLYQVVKENQ